MAHLPRIAQSNPPPARRPSWLWYFLSIPIFVVGVYSAIALMSLVIFKPDRVQADFVDVPGRKEIFLYEVGLFYIVSDNQQTVVNGDAPSQGDPSDILVTVRSKASGRAVTLLREAGTNDKTGRTTLTFNILQGEAFLFTAAYRNGAPGPAARLKITTGFSARVTTMMIMAGLMLFLGLAGPIALTAYIAIKRHKRAPPRIPPTGAGGPAG